VRGGALLLGHGSPDPAARDELSELRVLASQRLGLDVGLGVLEFSGQGLSGLDDAFAEARGGGPVAAQPLVLFDGMHGQRDLPAAAARAVARYGIEVRLGWAFGHDPALTELVAARLRCLAPTEGDLLLFVGRGSSKALARRQTEEVAGTIASAVGLDRVVCYAGISRPSLVEGMDTALRRKPERILVVPYLLHTGILARRVQELLVPIGVGAGTELVVLPHIGNAPEVVGLVADRLERLL
jgi:sirohydrochlorin ferrochelatase